jgi:hypothetical protein
LRRQAEARGEQDLLVLFRLDPCEPPPLLKRLAYLFTCPDEETARELVSQRLRKPADPAYRRPLGAAPFPGGGPVEAPFPVPAHNLPRPIRFVGRTAELTKLAAALAASGRTAITQPQGVIGLGGVGKTQLALQYAYARLADYDLIRWLRGRAGNSRGRLYRNGADTRARSRDTGPGGPYRCDPCWARALATLPACVRHATGPVSLEDYLPRLGADHVLITSRQQEWEDSAGTLELDVLPEPEAVGLLLGQETADPAQRPQRLR